MSTPLNNIQAPLLETATELFSSLLNIREEWPAQRKYAALRQTLTLCVNERLIGTQVKLSGLYAQIDYLLKQHIRNESDRSLSFALNTLRHHLRNVGQTNEEELAATFPTDRKALAQFIALTYDSDVPPELAALFPKNTAATAPKRLTDDGEKAVDNFRCLIRRWDNTYIYATREDTGEDVRIDYVRENPYVPGDWTYLRRTMVEGETINVVRPRTDEHGNILPELIVYAPDYLVSVTSITRCLTEVGASPYLDLLARIEPFSQSEAQLMGNFAGQLLDEIVYGEEPNYRRSASEFFRRNALCLAAHGPMSPDFHEQAQRQYENIRHLMGKVYEEANGSPFRPEEVMLEPSFFSDLLGLQGRMDFLTLDYRSIIEQKSGKCRWQLGAPKDAYVGYQEVHFAQILLYRALMHYDYHRNTAEGMHSFLLYSRYAEGLEQVGSAPRLLFTLFKLRNQLAYAETWYAKGGMRLLETITPEKIFPNAKSKLWNDYIAPQINDLLKPLRKASPLERAYYYRFMQFVANEQVLAKIGNHTKENSGFASVWNSLLEEKREAGNIFENLRMDVPQTTDGKAQKVEDVRFTFATDAAHNADLANFREGDIAFFYAYEKGQTPDATAHIVFRCTITQLTPESIDVRLRNPQTSTLVFKYFQRNGNRVWAMEHDFLDSSFTSQYRSLHAFLSAPQARRDLLLGQRQPEVDTHVQLHGDYGTEEFNNLVLHARQAKDIYLVIGPPGTGKTSYGLKNLLLEELQEEGTNVLLLSYTNRAVDEICSKLEEEGIDYLRIGNDYTCDEAFRPHLLTKRIEEMGDVNATKVRQLLRRTRVFCGTTTSLTSASDLFKIKQFSLAIIDEASQILEPQILGLLSAVSPEGDCAISRFVLIGDEKQLPAVVQQGEEEAAVNDELLRSAGLTSCALSLFERLLRLYGYNPDGTINEEVCHMLTHQGRMHTDIASFPSTAFYEGLLEPVPLPHQIEPTESRSDAHDRFADILEQSRMSFVSVPIPPDDDTPDKLNEQEAEVIAALVRQAYLNIGEKNFEPRGSIGVIVPYRNQIATVRAAIAKLGMPELQTLTIDTVERYQGSQRDYIIYGFTVKRKYQLRFLTSTAYIDPHSGHVIDRKLNVALTRARKRLVLVGNAPLLSVDGTFKELIDFCKERRAFYD